VLVALGGAVVGSYYAFFVARERRSEPARRAAEVQLRVTGLAGVVEIAGDGGTFHPAQRGDLLPTHARVRTGDDGSAELSASDGSVVRLLGATEARVDALRTELQRLHLAEGMVEADVREDATRLFEVVLDDQGAAARTRGARFTASANGAGSAAVAAQRGEVILSARGREVVIHTGEYARVAAGSPPSDPQPIPPSLFLKVAWPKGGARGRVVVSGTTAPGARVELAGHYVRVGEDGSYRRELDLPDGAHRLHVRALDVGGRRADEESPRIVIDTRTDFTVKPPKWK
jgi:hypothetical protein